VYFEVFIEILLIIVYEKFLLLNVTIFRGDYNISYGLYIYAFPVQQSIAYLSPQIRPLSMFVLSTIVTVALAILSWRLVEKPALKLKGKLSSGRHKDDVRAE